jgi:hypothetical protein
MFYSTGSRPEAIANTYLMRALMMSLVLLEKVPSFVSNKLGYYITLGCKVMPVTNTLAYWAHLYVTKKIKYFVPHCTN